MIAQRSSVYCTEIYIILLDKSAVCKADPANLGLEAALRRPAKASSEELARLGGLMNM